LRHAKNDTYAGVLSKVTVESHLRSSAVTQFDRRHKRIPMSAQHETDSSDDM